jgi:Gliding motility associated protein GldN
MITSRLTQNQRRRSRMRGHVSYRAGTALILLLHFAMFTNAQTVASKKVLERLVYRIVDINERQDLTNHHLKDLTPDSTLFDVLLNFKKSGRLITYTHADNGFANKLGRHELNNNKWYAFKPDTAFITDPVSGKELRKVIYHDHINVKYYLLEKWTFDPTKGATKITTLGIAPILTIEINGEKDEHFEEIYPLFWMKYDDAKNIITQYEQYHPTNTLSSHIWNDYFYGDVKPSAIK